MNINIEKERNKTTEKAVYEPAKMEIVVFESEDIITTSGDSIIWGEEDPF